jgi:site-specific DNA recombinase
LGIYPSRNSPTDSGDEAKRKDGGVNEHVYYRCARYAKGDHPRIRVKEADIEAQVLAIFDKMKVEDESIRDWFRLVLASQTRDGCHWAL